jgi:phage tail-like protein
VTDVSGLIHATQIISVRHGQEPPRTPTIPGQTDYQPVRLQRGITTDRTFGDWANTQKLGHETQLATPRKPMQIELHDQHGGLVLRFNLYGCWPSQYAALPELDNTEADAVGLASMTIEHEGWERDPSV